MNDINAQICVDLDDSWDFDHDGCDDLYVMDVDNELFAMQYAQEQMLTHQTILEDGGY